MIWNLKNITVRQLYELRTDEFDKYMTLKDAMKGKNLFNGVEGKKISDLSFAEVSEIKRIFISPTLEGIFETFNRIFNCNRNKFLRSDVISYFYALNHIGESVADIIEREKMLQPEEDEESVLMEQAGSKRLQAFAELPVILNLAERFGKTPQEIEGWKYSLVFAIMFHDKVNAEVRKKYNSLKKAKNGH